MVASIDCGRSVTAFGSLLMVTGNAAGIVVDGRAR
jgi:hypothetical protein